MVVGRLRGKALSMSCRLIECDILVSFWERQPRPWVWTNSAGPWVKQCEEGKNRVENLGEEVLRRGGEEERSLIQKFTVPTSSPPQILFTRRVQACGVTSVTPDSLRHLACQALLSVGFSRQEYWSGLPCPLAGDLPNPGIEHRSLMSPALAGGSFTTRATSQCRRLQANILSTPRDHSLRTSPATRVLFSF